MAGVMSLPSLDGLPYIKDGLPSRMAGESTIYSGWWYTYPSEK